MCHLLVSPYSHARLGRQASHHGDTAAQPAKGQESDPSVRRASGKWYIPRCFAPCCMREFLAVMVNRAREHVCIRGMRSPALTVLCACDLGQIKDTIKERDQKTNTAQVWSVAYGTLTAESVDQCEANID